MKFILNNKIQFGDKISVFCDILEEHGIELDLIEQAILVDLCVNDEFPMRYYKNNVLNLDLIVDNPELIYDLVRF